MGLYHAVTDSKQTSRVPLFSDDEILDVAMDTPAAIAQWALSTATSRGVSSHRRPNYEFVKAVSRLSDGVIDLDPVEELLVALGRAGVITSYQRGLLQIHYLR